jgi:ABC-2 type transport system permease protein
VRKRSFIIMTLLIPFLFIGTGALVGYLSVGSTSQKEIAVIDNSHFFEGQLESKKSVAYKFVESSELNLKKEVDQGIYDGALIIPVFNKDSTAKFELYSKEQIGMESQNQIEDQLNQLVINERMKRAGISSAALDQMEASSISLKTVNQEGKESSSITSYAIGYVSGLILYFFMLFYGMSVMRSVMEEKTSRIAEIIISSVKPFQLMLGKIIGVALVGLTQFIIWILLILVLGGTVLGSMGIHLMGGNPEMANQMSDPNKNAELIAALQVLIVGTNWYYILGWFLFYFLGGYFLYASLYAAVGSLVNEDPQESQQYTLPITLPIILGFVLMSSAVRDPNGGMALFGSLFPLTSPIVMMARIPFGVPGWQLALSAFLLIIGFVLTTGLAAKIYRTGILLYGKKVTLKEVGKWLFRK